MHVWLICEPMVNARMTGRTVAQARKIRIFILSLILVTRALSISSDLTCGVFQEKHPPEPWAAGGGGEAGRRAGGAARPRAGGDRPAQRPAAGPDHRGGGGRHRRGRSGDGAGFPGPDIPRISQLLHCGPVKFRQSYRATNPNQVGYEWCYFHFSAKKCFLSKKRIERRFSDG